MSIAMQTSVEAQLPLPTFLYDFALCLKCHYSLSCHNFDVYMKQRVTNAKSVHTIPWAHARVQIPNGISIGSAVLRSSQHAESLSEPTAETASLLQGFSFFCTAHRIMSLYFTMGRPFSTQNCPFPWGSGPPSNTFSLGPLESSTQTTSRSVQPFLQGSLL